MQETRTHAFIVSPKDLSRALKLAYPGNLRIATMPQSFRITSDLAGVKVAWDVTVNPEPQMMNEVA